MYTGELVIKSVGTATITATSADGQYTDSHTIKAWIDTVVIQSDAGETKVIFQSSNKVWWCVNNDLVFVYENWGNTTIARRAINNFYIEYDELNPEPYKVITNVKTYTDDELKLLYAIDPFGVNSYVHSYAEMAFPSSLSDQLAYKDHVFSLIYCRSPRYFARDLDGNWYETNDKSNLSTVLSESEELFGRHVVWDLVAWLELAGIIIDFALTMTLKLPPIAKAVPFAEQVVNVVKGAVKILSTDEETAVAEFMSYAINTALWSAFDSTDLDWISDIVSLYADLGEIAATVVDAPNFYGDILNYCVNNGKYLVYAKLKTGEMHKLDEICATINNYNNYN